MKSRFIQGPTLRSIGSREYMNYNSFLQKIDSILRQPIDLKKMVMGLDVSYVGSLDVGNS